MNFHRSWTKLHCYIHLLQLVGIYLGKVWMKNIDKQTIHYPNYAKKSADPQH